MHHAEYRFAAADGVELYAQSWRETAAPRAVVGILHGIFEHGGRHAFLATGLAARGYTAHAFDCRGHGRSGGRRASLRRYEQYLDDLDLCVQRLRQEEPHAPLFLFGHSLGGQTALLWAMTRELPDVAGLVLSAPVIVPGAGLFPLLRWLSRPMSFLFPRLRLVRMGCRNISRDSQVIAAYKNDPLVYRQRFEIRIGAEALRSGTLIRRNYDKLTVPFLVIHGTGDLVGDIAGSEELVCRAASADKTLKAYDGLLHECLSEPERDQVLADILAWLDARTVATGKTNAE